MTKQDTQVADLLKPRYKVIADWPESRYSSGDVLELNDKGYYSYDPLMNEIGMSKYPHLFKKLEWWEERSHAELPKYIAWYDPTDKRELLPQYFEVLGWGTSHNTANIIRVHTKDAILFIADCKPATEAEYINSKQQ